MLLSLLSRDEQCAVCETTLHSFNGCILLSSRPLLTHPYVLLTCLGHCTVHERPIQYHLSFRGKINAKHCKDCPQLFQMETRMSHICAVYDKISHRSVRGIQLIAHFPQKFPQIQMVCNPKKYPRLQIRFLENLPQVFFQQQKLQQASQLWYHFTLLDRSITAFEHPAGMGMSLGTQSCLPLLQCSIIMKALQRSSSKPLPFREARDLEAGKTSCHVRISRSSLQPTLLPSQLQHLPGYLQNQGHNAPDDC